MAHGVTRDENNWDQCLMTTASFRLWPLTVTVETIFLEMRFVKIYCSTTECSWINFKGSFTQTWQCKGIANSEWPLREAGYTRGLYHDILAGTIEDTTSSSWHSRRNHAKLCDFIIETLKLLKFLILLKFIPLIHLTHDIWMH